MSGLDGLKRAIGGWRLIPLGLAVLATFLPAVFCLLLGGWFSLLGLAAALVWALLGCWVWQAWRRWLQYGENNFEDYV